MADEMKTLVCAKCGKENSTTAKFCGGCGSSLKICPQCKSIISEGCVFCNQCGYQIGAVSTPAAPQAPVTPTVTPAPRVETPVNSTPSYNSTPSTGSYNQPAPIQQNRGPSAFEKLICYPALWVAIIAYIVSFALALGKIGTTTKVGWFSSTEYTSKEFMQDISDLLSYFGGPEDSSEVFIHWCSIGGYYLVLLSLLLGIGCLYVLYIVSKKKYAFYFNFLGFSALSFFAGSFLEFVTWAMWCSEEESRLGLNASFYISIIAYIIFITAFQNTKSFARTFSGANITNQSWICKKCGRENSYMFTRCDCGQMKSANY